MPCCANGYELEGGSYSSTRSVEVAEVAVEARRRRGGVHGAAPGQDSRVDGIASARLRSEFQHSRVG